VCNLRLQLANLKKGDMKMVDYFAKMKNIHDEIESTGKTINEDEMVGFVLNGLGFDYHPVVSSFLGRTDPSR
jgi:histone deacetylase 1/2